MALDKKDRVPELDNLRGGPNFDPVKYVKEVSHAKYMHANSILVHFNFSSKLMVM